MISRVNRGMMLAAIVELMGSDIPSSSVNDGVGFPMSPEQRKKKERDREQSAVSAIPKAEAKRLRKKLARLQRERMK